MRFFHAFDSTVQEAFCADHLIESDSEVSKNRRKMSLPKSLFSM